MSILKQLHKIFSSEQESDVHLELGTSIDSVSHSGLIWKPADIYMYIYIYVSSRVLSDICHAWPLSSHMKAGRGSWLVATRRTSSYSEWIPIASGLSHGSRVGPTWTERCLVWRRICFSPMLNWSKSLVVCRTSGVQNLPHDDLVLAGVLILTWWHPRWEDPRQAHLWSSCMCMMLRHLSFRELVYWG